MSYFNRKQKKAKVEMLFFGWYVLRFLLSGLKYIFLICSQAGIFCEAITIFTVTNNKISYYSSN